jgi:hypothetical protein
MKQKVMESKRLKLQILREKRKRNKAKSRNQLVKR